MRFLLATIIFLGTCASAASSVELQNINIVQGKSGSQMVITLNGPVKYNTFALEGPHRLVLDLASTNSPSVNAPVKNDPFIQRVRAEVQKDGRLRIVLDLKQAVRWQSTLLQTDATDSVQLLVNLQSASAEPAAAAAAAGAVAAAASATAGAPSVEAPMVSGGVDTAGTEVDVAQAETEPADAAPTDEPVRKQPPPRRELAPVVEEAHGIFELGRLVMEAGITYTRTERNRLDLSGFLVLDAIFLGRIQVEDVDTDIVQLDLTTRYSLTERLQVNLTVPALYRETSFLERGTGGANDTVQESVDDFDLGDINFGISYHLAPETASRPDIVWFGRVKAPTGSDPFGIKTRTKSSPDGTQLQFPEKLATGTGVWTASSGFSLLKTVDPAILIFNAEYFYNFEEDFNDLSTVEGEKVPGTVDLGDSIQFGMGFAIALSERISVTTSYSHRYTWESKSKVKGGNFDNNKGSDAVAGQLNFGATYVINNNLAALFNVAAGVTDDAPDVQVGVKLPYTF